MSAAWHVRRIRAMGSDVVLVGGAACLDAAEVDARLDAAARRLCALEAAWTRFDPASDLERLNASACAQVEVPAILGTAIAAALACRSRSGGLVDATLADPVARLGYDRTLMALDRVGADEVAATARGRVPLPARPTANPPPVRVRADRRVVERPPGVRIDLGGVGKGLAADRLVAHLRPLDRWAVSIGGDLRCGGRARDVVQDVDVTHPLTGDVVRRLAMDRGAAATSAVTARAWRAPDGDVVHHVLDPSTGRPAWTGLLQATAAARTALVAECRAKEALLRGPAGARRVLARDGGVLVHVDGTVEDVAPAVRLVPEAVAA